MGFGKIIRLSPEVTVPTTAHTASLKSLAMNLAEAQAWRDFAMPLHVVSDVGKLA